MENTTHYYPNAMLLFVPGFKGKPTDKDVLAATNANGVKELVSVNVRLTVRNNPGTFSASIIDTNHRFMDYDDLESEISTLYKYSNSKRVVLSQSNNGSKNAKGKVEEKYAGNYYGFSTFENWKRHNSYTLVEPTYKTRIPIYSKVVDNGIVEMWAYDDLGNFINIDDVNKIIGQKEYVDENGKKYAIKSTSNLDFLYKYKDKDIQGEVDPIFLQGKCKIKSMDRVMIFMTERFPSIDRAEEGENPMIRVFTGVVNTVQVEYSQGHASISLQGEDVTKFLKTSFVNVNPALLIDKNRAVDQTISEKITIWSSILKGLDAIQIIKLMLLGSRASGIPTNNYQEVDGVGLYTISDDMPAGRKIRYDGMSNSFVEIIKTKSDSGNTVTKASIQKVLGQLFTPSSVHIVDPYAGKNKPAGFRAYEVSLNNSWSFYQAEFKSRREICDRVAEDTHFVFYADRYGEIWFHPPRFDNNWILGNENPDIYVINTQAIISYGFIDTDENIFSSVYVTTEPKFGLSGAADVGIFSSSFRDDGIVLKYGHRIFTHSNPLINFGEDKTDSQNLTMYAKSLLQRLISGKYQGQIVLTGRSELNPGMPVYIPLINMIYYVETIDQQINFGDKHTTTLSLAYGRKPYEFLPELLDFGNNDEIYMTDAYLYRDYEMNTYTGDETEEQSVLKPNTTNVSYYTSDNVYGGVSENVVTQEQLNRLKKWESHIIAANQKYPSVSLNMIRSIILKESNARNNLTSSKGAKGLMQLMPDTATDMGVSNVFDPLSNILGGTKYYSIQFGKFKDESLALAAYNWGPGHIEDNPSYSSYPAETKDYIKKIRGYKKYLDNIGY